MISPWLKRKFGCKIVKLSLDGGFTCPNRDGSKGTGGCLFCSETGSGDMASTTAATDSAGIHDALNRQISLLSIKWPEAKYIAYFQSHTNTYAPVEELRKKYEAALEHPEVLGIAIATRSDCISEAVLDLLSELNEKSFLWVELGLQTIHEVTASAMNLCHTRADYDYAVERLKSRRIPVVTHLILGLPGETREMMLDSVRYAGQTFGLKLHMLNVIKGSGMEEAYPDYVPFETPEEYIDLLIDAVELIPPEVTIHRISGDAPRSMLLAPKWSYRKRSILNGIHREMNRRNTWQGRRAER